MRPARSRSRATSPSRGPSRTTPPTCSSSGGACACTTSRRSTAGSSPPTTSLHIERFLTENGTPTPPCYRSIDKVEAAGQVHGPVHPEGALRLVPGHHGQPDGGGHHRPECVEKFGDLKKPEAIIGTGPWMLDSYRPNVAITLVQNPPTSWPAAVHRPRRGVRRRGQRLPHGRLHRRQVRPRLGVPGHDQPADWVQIKDRLAQNRPTLPRRRSSPSNVVNDIYMRTDKPPFSDVRVRQAISHGHRPAGDHRRHARGRGRRQRRRSRRANRLGPADRPARRGRAATTSTTPPRRSGSSRPPATRTGSRPACASHRTARTVLVDTMQLVLKNLKAIGIDAKLNQKEYGAYISATFARQVRLAWPSGP